MLGVCFSLHSLSHPFAREIVTRIGWAVDKHFFLVLVDENNTALMEYTFLKNKQKKRVSKLHLTDFGKEGNGPHWGVTLLDLCPIYPWLRAYVSQRK